jgi:hypothetical protein
MKHSENNIWINVTFGDSLWQAAKSGSDLRTIAMKNYFSNVEVNTNPNSALGYASMTLHLVSYAEV